MCIIVLCSAVAGSCYSPVRELPVAKGCTGILASGVEGSAMITGGRVVLCH